MRTTISVLFALLIALGLTACATPPANSGNSPDEQRSHAHKAQDELSSEASK